jgi:ribosomal protein L18E
MVATTSASVRLQRINISTEVTRNALVVIDGSTLGLSAIRKPSRVRHLGISDQLPQMKWPPGW